MDDCTCVRTDTYDTDELGQRHLDGDGHLLALVDSRPDQFVVTLRTQQVVHQALFGVLRPAACRGTGGWWWWGEGGEGRWWWGGHIRQRCICPCTLKLSPC